MNNIFFRDTRQLLPEVVARSKTLSSAAFLNEKDIKDVLYNLPKQMEEVCFFFFFGFLFLFSLIILIEFFFSISEQMSPVRVKRELEPVLREMALENGVRTQRFKKSWTEEDEVGSFWVYFLPNYLIFFFFSFLLLLLLFFFQDAYLKKMSDLFCEAFLLRSAVVALKYDLKVFFFFLCLKKT